MIFDTATKKLSTYSPLVIDEGTFPAILPVPVHLTSTDIVGLFGGSNDNQTFLANRQGCDETDGQVFYCNTRALFSAIKASRIAIPGLGTDINGQVCPTVRSFDIVDQDQSDNVQTSYLLTADGRTAQNTAANRALLTGASKIVNPSDNRVLSIAVDKALGCTSWKVPDVADGGTIEPTQATNELQAAAYQEHPIALIPAGDPMVGPNNLSVLNTYRLDVDQLAVNSLGEANTQAYCAHLTDIGGDFINHHKALFSKFPSPIPGFANLYTFMYQRWLDSQQILGCH